MTQYRRTVFRRPRSANQRIQASAEMRRRDIQPTSQATTSKTSSIVKIFWFIVCAICFTYHYASTTQRYLAYETMTLVTMTFPRTISPPSISLCFDPLEIINEETLNDEQEKLFVENECYLAAGNEFPKFLTCISKILMRMKASELFSNHTLRLQDISLEPTEFPDQNRMEDGIEFFKVGLKCFKRSRFKSSSRKLSNAQLDFMRPIPGRKVLDAIYNHSIRSDKDLITSIVLHEPDKLSHFRENNELFITINRKKNLFFIDYEAIESRYLKSPFETNCIDYGTTEFESYGDCFEHCYQQHDEGFITTSDPGKLDFNMSISNNFLPNEDLDSSCSDKCRRDCITKDFYLSLLNVYGIESLGDSYRIIVFSSRPKMTITMIGVFDIQSYIIYIASILSLWFGCCIHETVTNFVKTLCSTVYKIKVS